MATTILTNCTCGKEDPERATLPFIVGNVAASADQPAIVLLTIEGVWVATKGYAEGIHKEGFQPLKEIIESFVANGGQIWACGACAKPRGITDEHLIPGARIVTSASAPSGRSLHTTPGARRYGAACDNDHSSRLRRSNQRGNRTMEFVSRYRDQTVGLLRIAAGLLFLQHGVQKLFGGLGGFGGQPGNTAELFSLMGLAGVLETFGAMLLVLGLLTRPVAFLLSGMMAVAYFMAHMPNAFFPIENGGELAALYQDFGRALLTSQRPKRLSKAEREQLLHLPGVESALEQEPRERRGRALARALEELDAHAGCHIESAVCWFVFLPRLQRLTVVTHTSAALRTLR